MLPRKVKALALPWGEATAVDTQFWVLPTCHCSAAASRDCRSDKQVKNSLKSRDKNIPTRVKRGISITNTILCVPVPGQVWRSCLSGRKNEAEIWEVSVCVKHALQKYRGFSPSFQGSAMIFLAQLCLVEFGNHHFGRNENSLTTSFFPQSRRNHTERKTQRTHLATGDAQTCILGFEAEYYNPLCSFSSPLFWPQVQAVIDELWGWFSWFWKPFPGPDASTALQGAQHNTHPARRRWRENSKDN